MFASGNSIFAADRIRTGRRPATGPTEGGLRRAFSLLELVIVLAILGVIVTIAVIRFNKNTKATSEKAVQSSLSDLRRAIERYQGEHGRYPDEDQLWDQLTRYTDITGNVSTKRTATATFGPYLRKPPVFNAGPVDLKPNGRSYPYGWAYDEKNGEIRPASSSLDSTGKRYKEY